MRAACSTSATLNNLLYLSPQAPRLHSTNADLTNTDLRTRIYDPGTRARADYLEKLIAAPWFVGGVACPGLVGHAVGARTRTSFRRLGEGALRYGRANA